MAAKDAHRIAQDFLNRQGQASIRGDVAAAMASLDIPFTLESMEGRTVATSEAEVKAICVAFIEGLQENRLTEMVRRCLDASFMDDHTVCATYETRYVGDHNQLAGDPYLGFIVLREKDDGWKASNIQLAVNKKSTANVALRDWTRGSVASSEETNVSVPKLSRAS
ncbi:hypothetical protein [Citreimonas salinaria]|uniref:SnoaL-like domain-containing protein n=1 Tax=Citreimonas salinaria TaxID=321339 RepID=A0A1H3P505_9RHOB|nr:hypothetical protein [Citreimonas salinaria]SDY96196.1 hypothetical protein SAMN05444340_1501 [Citreimonas salinaria]